MKVQIELTYCDWCRRKVEWLFKTDDEVEDYCSPKCKHEANCVMASSDEARKQFSKFVDSLD